MLKVAGLVGFLTIISKLLGLARDLVIANYFGTSIESDAFNMAYLFTGNLFILLGGIGGPFYNSVVAVLPQIKEGKITLPFIKNILFKSFAFLLVISSAFYFLKPYLLQFFINPEKQEYFNLTLKHIDILLPLIVICGPIGIVFAVLNIYKRYFEPSLSPAAVNIALISTVFIMGDSFNGLALSIGTSIGAVASFLLQLPSFSIICNKFKEGLLGSEDSKENNTESISDLKKLKGKYGHILYPALLTTLAGQAIVIVDSFFCDSLSQGSWTALVMGNRLIQLPLGVLLTAFLVPLFPKLSELAGYNNLEGMKIETKRALKFLLLLCIPATAIGMIGSEFFIKLLFERGAFDSNSTILVSTVFFFLCLSIIPTIYREIVNRIFYSFGDSRTPLFVMLFGVLVKIYLNSVFIKLWGLAGVPIATVIVIILNLGILLFILRRRLGSFICF